MDDTAINIRKTLTQSGELEIIEENCEGMNAYAFKAYQPNMKRNVFVKAFYYDRDYHDEILREPQLLVRATSSTKANRNIVRVFDGRFITVNEEKYFCLIMEFIEGESLLKTINTRAIGQQEAVRICCNVLNGLASLHEAPNHIVHRDLKPANILLSRNGEPKITDFGSCARLADRNSFVSASRHSTIYVPPEGWTIPSRYTIASDLYQTGIVLYELVNGPLEYRQEHWVPAFRVRELKKIGKSLRQLNDIDLSIEVDKGVAWYANRETLLLHGRAPRLYFSSAIKKIICKATNSVPDRRYQSATEFATALSRLRLPDWIGNPDGTYSCNEWNNYNWQIAEISKRSGAYMEISRSRSGGKWIRQKSMRSANFEEAFRKVDTARASSTYSTNRFDFRNDVQRL